MDLKDIYYKIDTELLKNDFWDKNGKEKKELIDISLKKYLISKINETRISKDNLDNLSINELVNILSSSLSNSSSLSHLIHYIILVIGNLQNYSIVWFVEDDEDLIENPRLEFEGKVCKTLTTHQNTSYIKTFNLVYDVFIKSLSKSNKLELKKYGI